MTVDHGHQEEAFLGTNVFYAHLHLVAESCIGFGIKRSVVFSVGKRNQLQGLRIEIKTTARLSL